jgi:hypothetical protein
MATAIKLQREMTMAMCSVWNLECPLAAAGRKGLSEACNNKTVQLVRAQRATPRASIRRGNRRECLDACEDMPCR